MHSSEFSAEHKQPTDYQPAVTDATTTTEVPEIHIVGEDIYDTDESSEVDTSSILASEERDYDTLIAAQTTREKSPEFEAETIEQERETDDSTLEDQPEIIISSGPFRFSVENSEVEPDPGKKSLVETVGDAIVEKVVAYLEGGDDEPTDGKQVQAAAAAEAAETLDTPEQVDQEAEITETPPAAAEIEVDNDEAGVEPIAAEAVEVDVSTDEIDRGGHETAIEAVGAAATALAEQEGTAEIAGKEAKGAKEATDIRELAEDDAVTEVASESDDSDERAGVPMQDVIGTAVQFTVPEVAQAPLVVENVDAELAAVSSGNNEDPLAELADGTEERQPIQQPAYTSATGFQGNYAEFGDDEDDFGPTGFENSSDSGPQLPTFKPNQGSRLGRIIDGIGTSAGVAGNLFAAGVSAASLPARVAKTKINDNSVKQESLFSYRITVQGEGKTQTVKVTSLLGKGFAKLNARIKFARNKLAP